MRNLGTIRHGHQILNCTRAIDAALKRRIRHGVALINMARSRALVRALHLNVSGTTHKCRSFPISRSRSQSRRVFAAVPCCP